jgi:hypothetical protein
LVRTGLKTLYKPLAPETRALRNCLLNLARSGPRRPVTAPHNETFSVKRGKIENLEDTFAQRLRRPIFVVADVGVADVGALTFCFAMIISEKSFVLN